MEDHAEHSKQEAASRREHGHRGNQGPHSSFEKKKYLSPARAQDTASLSALVYSQLMAARRSLTTGFSG